jgi:hypothetical protein
MRIEGGERDTLAAIFALRHAQIETASTLQQCLRAWKL